ncbi:hypothetical protein GMLC_33840 [Geomonas limicola]|uniref:CheW-like domain-containing protein n=1 Tax=Geomonas limicola TaxID=2740186 RepID=A0A6V8NB12_9BACT|nr:chemotaxis protein CheW [Geomonas limicola]GFO69805.1 hypothetical protein GMLC_33840 [Geomonas limicola]
MAAGNVQQPGQAPDGPALSENEREAGADLPDQESPEQVQAVLEARAAELAAVPPAARSGRHLDCLEFLLSGERYALELRYLNQTLPLTEFTPLFCTPPFVLGLTSLRGRIISIIDLRRFFELPSVGLADLNRVMVVADGSMEVGILADSILGVTSVAVADLQPAPSAFTGLREEFLAGVTADRLALLDLRKILADRRIVVHEEVG